MRQRARILIPLLFVLLLLVPTALAEYTTIRVGNGEYTGNMENNQFNGYGVFIGDDGSKYIGMFKDHRFHGLGMYIYPENQPDGVIHQAGMFENGRLNGEGATLYRDADSTRKIGEWENGQIRPGMGQYSLQTYEWKSLIAAPGVRYMGEVAYGTETPEGYGFLIREDGTTYLGQLEMGVPNGLGVQENPDFSYVLGEWLSGTLTEIIESKGFSGDMGALDWSRKATAAPLPQYVTETTPSATAPNNSASPTPDPRLPTAPPAQVSTGEGEAAMTEYVRFDYRDDPYKDAINCAFPFASAWQKEYGYEYLNDHSWIHAEFKGQVKTAGYGIVWVTFAIDFPANVQAGAVVDLKDYVGKTTEEKPYNTIGIGFEQYFNVTTSYDTDFYTEYRDPKDLSSYEIKWTTTIRTIPKDASLVIEFTSVEEREDGVTYQATFSAAYGTGDKRRKIENGEFHFTLPLIDPEW